MTLVAEGPPKYCPDCGHMLARSEFYASVTKGRVYAHTYCKVHERQRSYAWQRRNRKRAAEISAAAYARRKLDPERYAAFRERRRQYMRKRRGITPDRFRVASTVPVNNSKGASVPAKPFAAWLRTVMARENASILSTATRLGVSDKTLREALKDRREVELDTVERALIADDTITLRELYPELY